MLIHGRLIVTHNGLMLDEVRSLLQKSLRRQELDLAYRATKELLGHDKDQLPWKSIVTFMFEDHCLTDVATLETFHNCYKQNNKYKAIEILCKCFTCRHAACLQVVALDEEHRPDASLWDEKVPLDPELVGLVVKANSGIDCDILLTLIAKNLEDHNTEALIKLFALVNMAAKVENRTLTRKGCGFLLDGANKKPTLYHLVLSVMHKVSTDDNMKKYIRLCYNFATINDTPQGLILFCTLSQAIFKEKVSSHASPDLSSIGQVDWKYIPNLEQMPSWAVDKHTFRGKFGKESLHIFKRKFRNSPMSDQELHEFHGPRPKADLRTFFDVGCVCYNDILAVNPVWEKAKSMYLKQKPSQQKCAKITKIVYGELKHSRAIIFGKSVAGTDDIAAAKLKPKRKLTALSSDGSCCFGEPSSKQMKCETSKEGDENTNNQEDVTMSSTEKSTEIVEVQQAYCDNISAVETTPISHGPLLQLPTGSAKVYTRLDSSSQKVWKGPYKSTTKQNICIFFHRAMKEVFRDKHTLDFEVRGPYIIFPLLKARKAEITTVHKEFYDCIEKKQVSAENGIFVTRESLGLVQLHNLPQYKIGQLPESIWAHFAFRYVLNIGDSGLYNAIATETLDEIYGIDMEENRAAVKGNDLINMMFTKLPKRVLIAEIQDVLKVKKASLCDIFGMDFDFQKLQSLFVEYNVEDDTARCKRRLDCFRNAVSKL